MTCLNAFRLQELCGEVARVLLLFVWRCTRPRRLGNNVELLYALLHAQAGVHLAQSPPPLPLSLSIFLAWHIYVLSV